MALKTSLSTDDITEVEEDKDEHHLPPPTTTTTTTGKSIPNIVEEDDEAPHHRHYLSTVDNLTQLIDVELVLLIESFEEAKRRIDPVIAQINEARNKFDELQQQRGGGGNIMEMVRELQELKQSTSKLKSKIPFNLIAPEYQPAADPNVILQPRINLRKPTKNNPDLVVVDEELVDNSPSLMVDDIHLPTIPDEDLDLYFSGPADPRALGFIALWCFLSFPEGAFIKAGLLFSFMFATWYPGPAYPSTFQEIASVAVNLVSNGFIKPVYKKHSSTTVYGFWMDPHLRPAIKDRLSRVFRDSELPESLVISTSIYGEEDIIYRGSADPSTMSSNLMFLHLGKWQRSPTHHIEMPDPNLYFKYLTEEDIPRLRYISFRGVSVMKELPGFITHLWNLTILDLKSCHHLEVIPSDIGKLSNLTHLDMSECYFLDHMPASLSQLTHLLVLKGFFVGEINNDESCSLQDLIALRRLIKLNIYTSLNSFPSEDHLTILQGFKKLRNLTICWGGCSTRNENRKPKPKRTATIPRLTRLFTRDPDPAVGVKEFSFKLEKLDLRGVPEKGTRSWLRPSNFEKLEKLYIRGGQLTHLRNINQAEEDNGSAAVEQTRWNVKYMRLRHLSKMHMLWSELQNSFPSLISVEKVECPNLTSFPCEDNGLWTRDTAQPPATFSL